MRDEALENFCEHALKAALPFAVASALLRTPLCDGGLEMPSRTLF
jgi:hypothetical protein